MPHEVMGDSSVKVERMAGSAFDAEKPSGLEKQVGSKYSGSSPSKLSRSKYLSESGTKFRFLIMSKNKMPPELLAHFKKKRRQRG